MRKLWDLEISKFLNRLTRIKPVLPTSQTDMNKSDLI
jgi:hypothetical protein